MKNCSKIYHCWEFFLSGQHYKLDLWDSKISGKKVILNSKLLMHTQDLYSNNFLFKFFIGNIKFNIVQLGEDTYEMKIEGKKFKDLKLEEKEKKKLKKIKNIEDKNKSHQDEYNNKDINNNEKNYFEGKEKYNNLNNKQIKCD